MAPWISVQSYKKRRHTPAFSLVLYMKPYECRTFSGKASGFPDEGVLFLVMLQFV